MAAAAGIRGAVDNLKVLTRRPYFTPPETVHHSVSAVHHSVSAVHHSVKTVLRSKK